MAFEAEKRFIQALMDAAGVQDCPWKYDVIMAISIYVNDRELGRPHDQFSRYLAVYSEDQDREKLILKKKAD